MARKMQARSGNPSEEVLKKEVSRSSPSSLFQVCPLTSKDVTNAHWIFGPSLPCCRGKMARGRPDAVIPDYMTIPAELTSLHRYVMIMADVMFVLGLPFLITLPRRVRYVTVQFVPRRMAGELANALKLVICLYK